MKTITKILFACLLSPIFVFGQIDRDSINTILSTELDFNKKLSSFDSISVNSKECQRVGKELNKFHDLTYRPTLPIIIDSLIKTKDDTLIGLFVRVISYSTNSVDETQSSELAKLFIGLPDIILTHIKSYNSQYLNQYLVLAVESYLESDSIEENDKKKYRQKIAKLKN